MAVPIGTAGALALDAGPRVDRKDLPSKARTPPLRASPPPSFPRLRRHATNLSAAEPAERAEKDVM